MRPADKIRALKKRGPVTGLRIARAVRVRPRDFLTQKTLRPLKGSMGRQDQISHLDRRQTSEAGGTCRAVLVAMFIAPANAQRT